MINTQKNGFCFRDNSIRDKLKQTSFALYETVLYLDGHPNDKEALDYYNVLVEELEGITEAYEEKFGPLTVYSNNNSTWAWVSGPWPWESEAN